LERLNQATRPVWVEGRTCPGCGVSSEQVRCDACGVASQAGSYRIVGVLARGPGGSTYLARDEEGRSVALKELVFTLAPSAQQLEDFEREVALLRELDHPRLPRFLGGFRVGSGVHTRLYLAQAYVPGESLAYELEHRRFPEDEVRGIAVEVLEVLKYLHGLSPKVLHRDIKPANLIRDTEGRILLVGFGVARELGGPRAHHATLLGTFGYMPPEQLGGTVDVRGDLYALGATLIHLLARKPPESMLGLGFALDFRRHINVSAHTESFLTRLVAPGPEDRFFSAREALAFLGRESQPPRFRRLRSGLLLSCGVAALSGGILLTRWMSLGLEDPVLSEEQPPVAEAPREVPPSSPPGESVRPPLPTPPAPGFRAAPPPPGTHVPFSWIMAKWEMNRAGWWVQDTSGRGHHGPLPLEGAHGVFGGLEFEGTTGFIEVPDHPDLALSAPFTIQGSVKFLGTDNERGVIIARRDDSGTEAYVVETLPGRKLRFSIAGKGGQRASIEGELPQDRHNGLVTIYATLDETGEMRLYAGCEQVAEGVTTVRPLQELDSQRKPVVSLGGLKGQRYGFRGEIWNLELMRGVMQRTSYSNSGSGSGCSFSLKMAR
jgi:serine/threonine protein kinase